MAAAKPSPLDREKESAAIRKELMAILNAWVQVHKAHLMSFDWHSHFDSNEDVLVIETLTQVFYRVVLQPVQLSVGEARRRAFAALQASEDPGTNKMRRGRPPKSYRTTT